MIWVQTLTGKQFAYSKSLPADKKELVLRRKGTRRKGDESFLLSVNCK